MRRQVYSHAKGHWAMGLRQLQLVQRDLPAAETEGALLLPQLPFHNEAALLSQAAHNI